MTTMLRLLDDLWLWLVSLAFAFDDPDDWDVDLGGSECCIKQEPAENRKCSKFPWPFFSPL